MIITFRQGIISAKTDQLFINFAGNKININANGKSIDLAFAYGASDYLFSEIEDVTGAWGPFSSGINYWIYWDIDLRTGLRTFGSTALQPLSGSSLPVTKAVDQHFFDLVEKKMKVWDGSRWNEKLRVFAGRVQGGTTIFPESFGSQVGLNGNYSIGYILFDGNGQPITRVESGNTYFVTTEDKIHTQYDNKNAYKIDSLLIDGVAIEPIPAYHCLSWKGARQLGVTSYVTYDYPCVGISVEPSGKNQTNRFITKGFLNNFNNWNWTQPANTPLFVGATGEITTVVPQRYSLQKIGHIVSPDTIFVDIQEQIIIEDSEISPSPTPSITPSASIQPSSTPSPTPTATVSNTVTMTPTITPTRSAGASPTPTASVTRTPAATATTTPSVSPSPTPTPSSQPVATENDDILYTWAASDNIQVIDWLTYDGANVSRLASHNTGNFITGNAESEYSNSNDLHADEYRTQVVYGSGYGYRTANVLQGGTINENETINGGNGFEKHMVRGKYLLQDFDAIQNTNNELDILYRKRSAAVTYNGNYNGVLSGDMFGDGSNYLVISNVLATSDSLVIYATGYHAEGNPSDRLIYLKPNYTGDNSNGFPMVTLDVSVFDIGTRLYNEEQFDYPGLYEFTKFDANTDMFTLGAGAAIITRNTDTNVINYVSNSTISSNAQILLNTEEFLPLYASVQDGKAFVIGIVRGEVYKYYLLAIDPISGSIENNVFLGNRQVTTNARVRTSSLTGNTVIYTFTGYNIQKYINGQFVDAGVSEIDSSENFVNFIDTDVTHFTFLQS